MHHKIIKNKISLKVVVKINVLQMLIKRHLK
jgi:hypothetical protein